MAKAGFLMTWLLIMQYRPWPIADSKAALYIRNNAEWDYLSRIMTKPTKWHVRPEKTQISLGICSVWSESSLSAWRKPGSLATNWAHTEDSDQTGQMPRLIWVFAGRTCHFVGFVMRRLIYRKQPENILNCQRNANSLSWNSFVKTTSTEEA